MKMQSRGPLILAILACILSARAPLLAAPSVLDLYLSLPDGAALPGIYLMPQSTRPTGIERRKAVIVNDAANGYLKLSFGQGSLTFQTEVALFVRRDGSSFLGVNQIEKNSELTLSNLSFFERRASGWEDITPTMIPELPSLLDLKERLMFHKENCVRKDSRSERLFELPRYGTTIRLWISFPGCSFQEGQLVFDPAKGSFEIEPTLCLRGDCTNGKGTMIVLTSGARYVGQFRNGRYDGRGVLTSPMGDVYDGQWKNGKSDGEGNLTYADGSKYTGHFKNGKRDGNGTSYTSEGAIEHQGRWANDEFIGK